MEMLVKIYAKCIDGQEPEMNGRVMKGLGDGTNRRWATPNDEMVLTTIG